MTAKTFTHVFAVVVANDVLINSFDLRRRDVDDATAFSYFAKRQQNYVDIIADDNALDATFVHSFKSDFVVTDETTSEAKQANLQTFTRLVVIEQDAVKTTCERCAAKRGQAHASYCDVREQASEASASEASEDKKTALSVLQSLKIKASSSASVKAKTSEASADKAQASETAKTSNKAK